MVKPYYQDRYCSIYHGDCREIIPQLAGQYDCILSDPPYGTQELGGGYGRSGKTIANDVDLSVTREGIQLAMRYLDNGYIGIFCSPRKIFEAVEIVGTDKFLGEVIWDKGAPGLGYSIRYSHETLLMFTKGGG